MIKALFLVFALASAEIYFQEEFGEGWEDRWVQSESSDEYGKFVASAGKFFDDEARDTGLQTSEDARFYSMSASFPKFSNAGKDLVVQYSVKHEQKIDCGGGYLKLGSSTVNQKQFNGDTEYNYMFGPDICGATKRTHFIINYKGDNVLRTNDARCESDELTHLYTLHVKPDNSYEILIDQKSIAEGTLEDDFKLLAPKQSEDPDMSKPKDWVDEPMMADPEDVKPAGYDDIPEFIVDPAASLPDGWDEEEDGEWEAPVIPNPEFQGEWSPKMIDNPDYKGPWVHPLIDNPDYKADDSLYSFSDFGVVGIDIWQVKSGTVFDNIIITDSMAEAEAFAASTWGKQKGPEKKLYDAEKEAEKAKADDERAKRDAEIKAMEDEDESEDEDDVAVDDEADAKRKEKLEELKKKKVHTDL